MMVFLSEGGEIVAGENGNDIPQFCSRQDTTLPPESCTSRCGGIPSQLEHYSIDSDVDGEAPFELRFYSADNRLCVPAVAGSALFMYNMHADGTVWPGASLTSCPLAADESQWILRIWQQYYLL
jgi:hypothetical protein